MVFSRRGVSDMDVLAVGHDDGCFVRSLGARGVVFGLRSAPDLHRARLARHPRLHAHGTGPLPGRGRRVRIVLTPASRSYNRRSGRCPGWVDCRGRGRKEEEEMSPLTLWLTIVGAGAGTFALRLSFIALLGRVEIPLFFRRVLRFVPAAVLTAFVIPLLFYENGALHVSLGNERLLAGLVAALIAWRTRSVLFTLGAGMATLWTLQAVGQSL